MYLDLTDAAEAMLAEMPPESLEAIDEEALKSHVLGLNEVETMLYWFSVSITIYSFNNGNEINDDNMTRCELLVCKSVVILMLEIIGKATEVKDIGSSILCFIQDSLNQVPWHRSSSAMSILFILCFLSDNFQRQTGFGILGGGSFVPVADTLVGTS